MSITDIISNLLGFGLEWYKARRERAVKNWLNWRANAEARKIKRNRRAEFIDSVDMLCKKGNKDK